MISGRCPRCGRFVRFPRQESICRCPECGTEYELALDLDRWVLKKPGTQAATVTGLVEFELHLAPTEFRLRAALGETAFYADTPAAAPAQHKVLLLPHASEEILAAVSKFVMRDAAVFSLPMHDREWAFTSQALQGPSFHLRVRSATGDEWASVYPIQLIPPPLWQLFEQVQRYMQKAAGRMRGVPASEQVLRYNYAMPMYEEAAAEHGAIVRVKVSSEGYIFLDEQPVGDWRELDTAFEQLRQTDGLIWYYREDPDESQSLQVEQIALAVMDKILASGVPMKVFTQEFA